MLPVYRLLRMGRRGKRPSQSADMTVSPSKRPAVDSGHTSKYFTLSASARTEGDAQTERDAQTEGDAQIQGGGDQGPGTVVEHRRSGCALDAVNDCCDDKGRVSPSHTPVSPSHTGSASSITTPVRLGADFFDQSCEGLARSLLGKTLVRVLGSGQRLEGTIVETESYLGGDDKASHSYKGKRTQRNAAMFMAPGTAYVYHIYGMYTCLNISSRGEGAAILLRGVTATQGLDLMRDLRSQKRSKGAKILKDHELCNGPSKLTQAFQVSKEGLNKQDLCTSPDMWVEEAPTPSVNDIVACPRIGIGSAEEWTDAPLRFYIRGNKGVSVKNKEAEAALSKK